MENIKVWSGSVSNEGYKLLDSGNKKKLEEIGGIRISRNEPRAWWQKELPEEEWKKTKAILETTIDTGVNGIKAKIKFKSSSKHIGIFPEQQKEWEFIKEKIIEILKIKNLKTQREINVLNLFGYTGIATLVAVKSGLSNEDSSRWSVIATHVDASKQSVDWARENQKISGLENAPIRWIVDDVLKFIKKENRQSKKYDAIVMDPPSYGKGPKGEVWKIEEQLPELLKVCRELLSPEPLFIILNMYSTELSSISVKNLLADITKDLGGNIQSGELVVQQQSSNRLLPMSIFALWERN